MAKRGTVSRIFFRYRFYLKGLKKYEADGILYVLAEEVAKMIDIHETKEWKEMVARVDRRVAAEGGSTGSNMAEPPWVPPGPVKIPDGLPPEERARRERLLEELKKDPPFRNLRD